MLEVLRWVLGRGAPEAASLDQSGGGFVTIPTLRKKRGRVGALDSIVEPNFFFFYCWGCCFFSRARRAASPSEVGSPDILDGFDPPSLIVTPVTGWSPTVGGAAMGAATAGAGAFAAWVGA